MKSYSHTIVLALLLLSSAICHPSSAYADGPSSVFVQELTWMEVQTRLQSGTTTVIVPTGGTEQQGPQLVTGKHNSVVRYAAGEIARRLGNALVAPVIPYAPSGRIDPPEGHMLFPGTISITPRSYSLMLADIARSLKQHGFRTICLIGDSLASQSSQAQVAQALSQEWESEGVKVLNVTDFYAKNGHDEWSDASAAKVSNPAAHGGYIDTSEMMSVDSGGVRLSQLAKHTEKDYKTTGAAGDSSQANATSGKRYVSLKIEAAVKQIQNAVSYAH